MKIFFTLLCLAAGSALYSQGNLYLGTGSVLKMTAGSILTLDNTNLVNNGQFQQGSGEGTVRFAGNGNVNISGSNTAVISQLEIAKTGSAYVLLQSDVSVIDEVLFTSGLLNLGDNVADLGTTGVMTGESETSRAYTSGAGYVEATRTLNGPLSANPGNLGAIITSNQNLGLTTIQRGHRSQTNTFGTGNSILRYYDILPTNNAGLNATLRFQYLDAELNGLSEASMDLWKKIDNVHWVNMGATSRNATLNWVEKTAIPDFSKWTLSSPGNPLPVLFTYFNSRCNRDDVLLSWQTAQEFNSLRFDIERSADGTNWQVIGSVPAAGNSSTATNYQYTDAGAGGQFVYRVVEVDRDGRKAYSTILRSSCSGTESITAWPNPFAGDAFVRIVTADGGKFNLTLFDSKGALVYSSNLVLPSGSNTISLPLGRLAKGVYTLSVRWESGKAKNVQVVKQY